MANHWTDFKLFFNILHIMELNNRKVVPTQWARKTFLVERRGDISSGVTTSLTVFNSKLRMHIFFVK